MSTEFASLMGMMEAKQDEKVHTADAPNAFTETKLDDTKERIILMSHGLASELSCDMAPVCKPFSEKERGQSVLHLECTDIMHRTPNESNINLYALISLDEMI